VRYQYIKTTRKSHHQKKSQVQTQRDKLDDDLQDIVAKLKEKHPDMEVPKISLWAKLIKIMSLLIFLLITGKVGGKSKKSG